MLLARSYVDVLIVLQVLTLFAYFFLYASMTGCSQCVRWPDSVSLSMLFVYVQKSILQVQDVSEYRERGLLKSSSTLFTLETRSQAYFCNEDVCGHQLVQSSVISQIN